MLTYRDISCAERHVSAFWVSSSTISGAQIRPSSIGFIRSTSDDRAIGVMPEQPLGAIQEYHMPRKTRKFIPVYPLHRAKATIWNKTWSIGLFALVCRCKEMVECMQQDGQDNYKEFEVLSCQVCLRYLWSLELGPLRYTSSRLLLKARSYVYEKFDSCKKTSR